MACHFVIEQFDPNWVRLGGSYLYGNMIDYWSSQMQRDDHKKRKGTYVSDIDLVIDSGVNYQFERKNIDVRNALPDSIEIWNKKQGFVMWKFEKLDLQAGKKAKKAFDDLDYKVLMDIHNEYELSNETFTCPCESQRVYKWYKYGFDNQLISYEEKDTTQPIG